MEYIIHNSMAAIDFSDLTKPQPKPQGFKQSSAFPELKQSNAQGFYSPDKIPEEKKVQPASMGYPTQKTQSGDELMQLFPTPVLICPYPVDYTK